MSKHRPPTRLIKSSTFSDRAVPGIIHQMLPITRKFLIASAVYFLLGLAAQAAITVDVWLGVNPLAYSAATATRQILLVGWLTQAVLALIYDRWLTAVPQKSGQLVFVLLNVGLPLVVIGQPGVVIFGGPWIGAAAALGALLQLAAGIIFARALWNLLREKSQ